MAGIFNKKLPHACAYCVHGRTSLFSGEILCPKHGITDPKDFCGKYKYDPLKRVPEQIKIADNYTPEDFSL